MDSATGHAEVTAGSGDVRLRGLDASAVVKSSNGDTWVGVAGGDLRIKAANGSIAVDVAHASVVAKFANGDVRVGEVGAARSCSRPGSATSRSASAKAPPPGST